MIRNILVLVFHSLGWTKSNAKQLQKKNIKTKLCENKIHKDKERKNKWEKDKFKIVVHCMKIERWKYLYCFVDGVLFEWAATECLFPAIENKV